MPASWRSYAWRNWWKSQTTLFGWRATYDGKRVAIKRSMGTPLALVRSRKRQARAERRTSGRGFHAKGISTVSAAKPRATKAVRRAAECHSAPPRTKGTAAVAVGLDRSQLTPYFGSVRLAGRVHNRAGVNNDEESAPIWICADRGSPWSAIWPHLKHYG